MNAPATIANISKTGVGYAIRAQKNGKAEIFLYDVIDRYWGISAKQVVDDLKALGEVTAISVRINSEGGQVFEGLAIHNALTRHAAEVTVHVDGMALSIASLVAMAGDAIVMGDGAMMMVHDPMGVVFGDAEEMRSYAEVLDKLGDSIVNIYAERTGQPYERIVELLDDETWMTAAEAVELGFADRIDKRLSIAACAAPRGLVVPPRFESRFSADNKSTSPSRRPEATPAMSDPANTNTNSNQNQPAGYAELKAAFPKAAAEFLTAQLDSQATIEQARAAYQTQLEASAAAATKKAEEAEAKAAEAQKKLDAKSGGVDPIGDGKGAAAGGSGDAIERFQEAVAARIAAGVKDRARATAMVVRDDPELHAAYLAQYNALHKPTRGR